MNISNISNISRLYAQNVREIESITNIKNDIKNGMDEYSIVLLLCFSAIILIYVTRFIKPEPDDDDDDDRHRFHRHVKKLRIDPYAIFLSPLSISPFSSPLYTTSHNKKYFDTQFQA